MFLLSLALVLDTVGTSQVTQAQDPLVIVSRAEWNAKAPKAIETMPNPVPYVIIHHSYIPPACHDKETCIAAMQWMQDFHQINRSWNDIGYSFGVGGDGRVYEGRGWSRVGAHAPTYNNKSIGICVIGDWRVELPPPQQLLAVKNLISYGVETGMIEKDYILVTHRQVREGTECPGERLFQEVSTWKHFYPSDLPKWKPGDENIIDNRQRGNAISTNKIS